MNLIFSLPQAIDWYSWGVIIGMSLVIAGGLIRWAYGAPSANEISDQDLNAMPAEAAKLKRFLRQSSRSLSVYAVLAILLGLCVLGFATWALFNPAI